MNVEQKEYIEAMKPVKAFIEREHGNGALIVAELKKLRPKRPISRQQFSQWLPKKTKWVIPNAGVFLLILKALERVK